MNAFQTPRRKLTPVPRGEELALGGAEAVECFRGKRNEKFYRLRKCIDLHWISVLLCHSILDLEQKKFTSLIKRRLSAQLSTFKVCIQLYKLLRNTRQAAV